MAYRLIKYFTISSVLLITATSNASCPCFNRFYLYSIFYSEKEDTSCVYISNGINDEDNQINTAISIYRGTERQPSNYGEVRSHADRCELLIDNQVTSERYASSEEKYSCDRELRTTCDALNREHPEWPRADSPFKPK